MSRLWPGSPREIKTMWKMWIQLLCACVLYPMGSRGFSWPYMGIVTSYESPDLNARIWLVDKIFAALWLVSTQRGQYYYSCHLKSGLHMTLKKQVSDCQYQHLIYWSKSVNAFWRDFLTWQAVFSPFKLGSFWLGLPWERGWTTS